MKNLSNSLFVAAIFASLAQAQQSPSPAAQPQQPLKPVPCAAAPKPPSWFHPKLPPAIQTAIKNAQVKAGGSIDINGAIKSATTQKPCVVLPAAPPVAKTPAPPKEPCVVLSAPVNPVTGQDDPLVTKPCSANITAPDFVTSFPPKLNQ